MAHGPCGEQFKAAFSCFVYSTEEPKGMDCIDKFKYVLITTAEP
jgi:intermembrane space import and assembly protein 40